MNELRPIIKDIEQQTLDIARVFKLLSNEKLSEQFFTNKGIGYLNALSSMQPKLFVVREDEYLKLKSEKESLRGKYMAVCKENKLLKSKLKNKLNKKWRIIKNIY